MDHLREVTNPEGGLVPVLINSLVVYHGCKMTKIIGSNEPC